MCCGLWDTTNLWKAYHYVENLIISSMISRVVIKTVVTYLIVTDSYVISSQCGGYGEFLYCHGKDLEHGCNHSSVSSMVKQCLLGKFKPVALAII